MNKLERGPKFAYSIAGVIIWGMLGVVIGIVIPVLIRYAISLYIIGDFTEIIAANFNFPIVLGIGIPLALLMTAWGLAKAKSLFHVITQILLSTYCIVLCFIGYWALSLYLPYDGFATISVSAAMISVSIAHLYLIPLFITYQALMIVRSFLRWLYNV